MYNLRNIHQRQSFKSFVNEQMKESLITGKLEYNALKLRYYRKY